MQNKTEFYKSLAEEIGAFFDGDWLASLANVGALLKQNLPETNWVGVYLYKNGQLVLGPFQGLPACTPILLGRGVCGKSAKSRQAIRVHDVHEFHDHIVCDSNSRSELAIPLIHGDVLYGVLDFDSPQVGRFDAEDQAGLELIAHLISLKIAWPKSF